MFRYVNQGISVEKAINKIFPYGALLPKDYKGLEEVMYRSLGSDQENRIKISSIQSIKGLDEEKCLFVVTSQFIPYLKQDRNKDSIRMKSHLYVALTRAKSKLTILICKDVEEKYRKEDIMDLFDKYGITALS
ncbi:3'-5' exonuclease [Tetragenococcus halophilus]|uniref:3'-5' exonuclease n=1 Tax=Tetragenococcus halophilus TaxID=51669 RepID=UPI0030C8E430